MKNIINLAQGIVEVTAQGPFPERLVNLCAQHGVAFWGLAWQDVHTITFCLRRWELKRLRELGERVGCSIQVGTRKGLPYFIGRFRKRYAFLVGLSLSLLCVFLLSQVVLTVEVEGNETVPSAQILGELRRLGLRPGVYGPGLELKQMAQEALVELEELSWLNINLHGTRAQVIVREAVQPPEIIEEEGFSDIISKTDGIVTHIEPHRGDAVVKEGDTILMGDVLITGNVTMEPPEYSDQPPRYYQTRARGKVWARTWRTLTAQIPLTAQVKDYTGEEKSRYALNFFGRRVDFYRNSSISWPFYDKITNIYSVTMPSGAVLPLSLVREQSRAYQLQNVEVNREAAQTLLEQELHTRLLKLVGEEGTVESTQYSAQVSDGWLRVTLSAECQEEVGKEVSADYGPTQPIPTESGAAAP